jgi:hypothetical protein
MAENKETKSAPNNTGEKKTDSGYASLLCAILLDVDSHLDLGLFCVLFEEST